MVKNRLENMEFPRCCYVIICFFALSNYIINKLISLFKERKSCQVPYLRSLRQTSWSTSLAKERRKVMLAALEVLPDVLTLEKSCYDSQLHESNLVFDACEITSFITHNTCPPQHPPAPPFKKQLVNSM